MYYYIKGFICTHILQSFYVRTCENGLGGLMVCQGVGHPPCKHVSSMVIDLQYVKFYC